ncbi:hypothetical protein D9M71_339120 [compost metagenome]
MGANRLAGRNKFQRRSGANQTRQTLRTTSAGQQAKLDFRKTQARAGFSHPVAAGHGELKPTAQCYPTDGGDQRFVQLGQTGQQAWQVRLGKGRRATKLGNVGAGAKHRTFAVENNRFHAGVRGGAFTGLQQLFAQGLAESVNGSTGKADQGQRSFAAIID